MPPIRHKLGVTAKNFMVGPVVREPPEPQQKASD